MGDAAGRTFPQLHAQAAALMKQSLFDDDEIMRKVTANMLTFGKVSGPTFDRAQLAAVNLATKLNGDLQGATMMVGKALNDPAKGITAMTRAGVSFTAEQKKMIKTMAEAGDVAGAQKLILSELDKQFGGSGKAARQADPIAAAALDMGELQQAIGEKLIPAMIPVAQGISGMLDSFNALSPGTQKLIVGFLGVAAVFGPIASGFGAVASVVGGAARPIMWLVRTGPLLASSLGMVGNTLLAVGRAALANPIVLAAVAIGAAAYLIYRNWEPISAFFVRLWGGIKSLFAQYGAALLAPIMPFIGIPLLIYQNWGAITGFFGTVWNGVKSAAATGFQWFAALPGKFGALGKAIITGLISALSPTALAARLIAIAKSGITAFKNFFGIKSPSRLFMAMGGHMTAGLAQGIDQGGRRPLRAIGRLASGVAGAGALSLAAPAQASAGGTFNPTPLARAAQAQRPAQAAAPITIQIYQQPGEDAEALAERVMRKIEAARRRSRLSSYADDFE
jgi:hypothetical protein